MMEFTIDRISDFMMKYAVIKTRFFMFIIVCILLCQFSSSIEPDIAYKILSKRKYESHIYYSIGRYGPKEIDPIKS